jgi:hypothetical protein
LTLLRTGLIWLRIRNTARLLGNDLGKFLSVNFYTVKSIVNIMSDFKKEYV